MDQVDVGVLFFDQLSLILLVNWVESLRLQQDWVPTHEESLGLERDSVHLPKVPYPRRAAAYTNKMVSA